MMDPKRVREERSKVWDAAKAILDRATNEGRGLTSAEDAEYQRLNQELDDWSETYRAAVERSEAQEAYTKRMRELGIVDGHRDNSALSSEIRKRIVDNDRRPFEISMRGVPSGVEARDISTSSGTGLPVRYANEIVKGLVSTSGILAAGARIVTTETGEDYKVPKGTANGTAAIVAEGAAIGESDPTLSVATLNAFKYGVLIDVTYEMLKDASFDVAAYLALQAGESIGTAFGGHLATGDGSSKPSGVATAASAGVTGGTGVAGAFTADNLIDLQHSLSSPYQRNAAWVMRSATLGAVRKLKSSGGGDYLFTNDVRPDDPQAVGTLLGRPVYLDEAIAAVGLSAKSVLYGDFTRVWVRQTEALRFESSEHYRFGNDIVSYRCLHRLDGKLIDSSAVKAFAGGAS